MKQRGTFIILLFLITLNSNLSAQGSAQPIHADTSFFRLRSNGTIKPVSQKKADRMLVDFYQNQQLFERKILNTQNNQLIQHKYYKDGRPSGKWQYFDESGTVVRERNFDKLVYGPCPKKDSIPDGDFTMPQFGSGDADLMKYLGKRIVYPEESRNNGTSGTVYMNFIVDKKGRVIPNHICGNGLDGYCDLVVWEIVEKMPAWKPGIHDGQKVDVGYYLPIRFTMR